MLTKGDIGRRVVIRRRLPTSQLTDVLGELRYLDDTHLVVLTDRNELIIPCTDIVASKVIPPRPVKYSRIAAVERAPGRGPATSHRLGDWLLRIGTHSPELSVDLGALTDVIIDTSISSNVYDSALAMGDPGIAVDDAIEFVEDWYGSRGLTPRFCLPLPLMGGLDRMLAGRGWTEYASMVVLVADSETLPATGMGLPPVADGGFDPHTGITHLAVTDEEVKIERFAEFGFRHHHRRIYRKL